MRRAKADFNGDRVTAAAVIDPHFGQVDVTVDHSPAGRSHAVRVIAQTPDRAGP
jgi:hypothetical protein